MKMTNLDLDRLIASARLSGRIDLLSELRNWLNEKMKEAEEANEEQRANLSDKKTK